MKLFRTILLGFGLVASAKAAVLQQPQHALDAPIEQFVRGAYIVELHHGQDADAFLQTLRSMGLEVRGRRRLSSRLFNGQSFDVLNSDEPDHVLRKRVTLPNKVKKIWPVGILPPVKHEVMTASRGRPNRNGPELRKRDLEYNNTSPHHIAAQIDKLHAAGYTGKGIRIGIIDTAVDYTHPALGGCFGEGCLISYGKDLVGSNYDWDHPPVEDDDPMEDGKCAGSYGHGTHVTGVVAAQPNEYGFIGAAPGATIGFFKICGGFPYPADIALEAVIAAAEESDLITWALGLVTNSPDDPVAYMASRIAESGIPVVASASNAASYASYWTVTSPCIGGLVTCVGASVPDKVPMILLEGSYSIGDGPVENWGRMATYASGVQAAPERLVDFTEDITLPLWDVDYELGGEDAACEPLPDDVPDLSEYLVLIGSLDPWGIRGSASCNHAAQMANLAEKGAKQVLVYYRRVGDSKIATLETPEGVSFGFISKPVAAVWREAIAAGSTVTVSIVAADDAREYLEYVPNDDNADSVAAFSSWGPDSDLNVNPQIIAPGDFVLSTYPVEAGRYSVIGGTSFSAPMAAGLFALLMEARNTTDPRELTNIITGTAKNMPWFDNEKLTDKPAPVAQQGSGLVQGWDALQAVTILDRTSFSFNDSVSFKCKHEFTFRNEGDEEITYHITHLEGLTGYALPPDDQDLMESPIVLDLFDVPATLTFKPETLTLGPGEKAKIKVKGVPPKGLDAERMPIYGGWVRIHGSNNQTLSLSYQGMAGSLGARAGISPGQTGGTWLESRGAGEAEANMTFTLPTPDVNNLVGGYTNLQPGDPFYHINVRTSPQTLRLDVVALGDAGLPTTDHLGYKSVGMPVDLLGPFPVSHPPRAPFGSKFFGVVWPGIAVPEGYYQLVASALRVYGDAENVDDWDVVELPPFHLKYEDEEQSM